MRSPDHQSRLRGSPSLSTFRHDGAVVGKNPTTPIKRPETTPVPRYVAAFRWANIRKA